MFSKWFSFFSSNTPSKSVNSFSTSSIDESSIFLNLLVEIINQLQHDIDKFSLPLSYSKVDLDKCLKTVQVLQKNWLMQPSAKFEWVPGKLVNAIEHGEWVVLDNANLCNPTVLDRINSLVEPNGSITINECGLVEGKSLILNAHSRFRMFITIDPKYGEISRAMRNRGVEIFMLQAECLPGELTVTTEEIEGNSAKRFLTLSGIPLEKMILSMNEAHSAAITAGLSLGVRITLLELARWVQLFQQLIMNGNDPIWSLQLSWEHTYLAALGEPGGREVVMLGKISYLSDTELYKINPHFGYSLSLPGGWPLPHTLRNFVHYSRESCVKQNCSYLEFLSAQIASYSLSRNANSYSRNKYKGHFPAILPVEMLHQYLLPNIQKCQEQPIFDLVEANQMLTFAGNWTTEQATESDLDMYIGLFKWFHIKLQPYCCFFESFYIILEKEKDHPIWKCIRDCRKELLDHHRINIDMQPIPLLSPKLAKFSISDSYLLKRQHRLTAAIHCARILRRTFQQWSTDSTLLANEDVFKCAMQKILSSLMQLEREMLNQIVNFKELFYDFSYFLELHILFWENVKSSHLEHLSIIWSWLKKKVMKFQPIFPEAVGVFLVEDMDLKFVPGWKVDSGASTLWLQGGHPFVPPSANVFYKLEQLTRFCEMVWKIPRLSNEIHIDEKTQLDVIISINTDLRRLATEGVSMVKYIASKDNHCDAQCLSQLEEIYQMIFSRFEHERRRLESTSRSTQNYIDPSAGRSRSPCCYLSSEILCRRSCFDCWLVVLLLLNRRSLTLDINLLSKLSNTILVDAFKVCKALPSFHVLIQQALDYSLNYSSRSPVEFSPHQTFLWIFDAGISVDSAHLQFRSLILEMWFGWHSSLWNCLYERVKRYPWIREYELFPTRTQILGIILNQGSFPIKDYDVNCLKHRVTSRALWQDGPLQDSLMDVLLSSADYLFKQILFVHEKYFKRDVFESLKLILFELTDHDATLEEIQTLRSYILSSSLSLFSSLMDSLIQPLLEELYAGYSLNDFISLGKAWVHIGILRFHLLLYPDGSDPAVKNALKNSWIHRRMSLLELEMKVRRDCERLAGKCTDEADEWFRESQEKLEMEEKCAKAKIVFRPQPSKYNKLKLECFNFLGLVGSCTSLLKNAYCNNEIDIIDIINKTNNWQATSQSFITRLSEDFTEYMDLVQPIQVAVYEIKLGLSLFISGITEREYMSKIGINKIDNILDPICLLMQFPKTLPLNHSSLITLKNFARPKMKPCENRGSEGVQILDIPLLDSLIDISSKISTVRDISHLQQQSIIYHITFLHVVHTICSSQVMDKDSFLLLNEIFRRFSNSWIVLKSKAKESEEAEAQYFKFRPRSVILNDFVDVDEAYLGIPESGGDHSSECQELLLEREFLKLKEPSKEVDDVEEDWNLIPESILSSLVQAHNQLFGSGNLLKPPGVFFITDQERLLSFMDSYRLGTTLLEGLQGLSSSVTDDNLLPEHLLRVCVDYKLSSGSKICHSYNVYKDSNAEVMFTMVEPLTVIQNKVKSFLEEWHGHPGLMKVIEIIETLLEIPPCTPLSKALLGLQLLVGKIQFLQENDSRFRLKDEIQPLYDILSSWQKLEVDSWTTLLDGVSNQHEVNAAKLWFPLYGVLHRSLSPSSSGDNEADKILTIRSVEEFICTSSVGEFKKRLQLLLAFHGQLKDGIHLQAYFSPDSKGSLHVEENLKILYNAFGYYIQFLPRVLKRIEAGKGSIEKDLKEYSRLFSWEHPCTHSSLESSRKTRQKICKLIQKFNDVLQEPVMVVLAEEAKLIREEDPAWLKQKISDMNDSLELQFPIDLEKLGVTERFLWFGDWKRKTNTTFQNFNDGSNGVSSASECLDKNFKTSWDAGWKAIERICKNAASFSHIWKQETRNLRKRRSLTELLKYLEECGLSRHKLVDFQDLKSGQPSSSFLQPSFNARHLLLQEGSASSTDTTTDHANKFEENADIKCSTTWAVANQFYFKSLTMIHQLHECQTCFSKDLTLELVNQVVSYIHHLVVVQRDQRSIAYGVSNQIEKLRKLCHLLCSIDTHCSLSPHQYLIVKRIWQQKDLFDSLLALLKDMHIFLVTVKRSHMDTCDKFRDEADNLSAIVDKFIPLFMQSKDKLDRYLLGSNGVVSTLNSCMPCIVSVQMEHLVGENFHIINTLEESVNALAIHKGSSETIKDSLLSRIRKIISEANKENVAFNSEVEAHNQSMCDDHSVNKLNDVFGEAYERTNKALVGAFGNIDLSCADHCAGGLLSAKDITSWRKIFESYMENLHLDRIYDGLLQTNIAAFRLVDCAGIQNPDLCTKVGIQLKHLYLSLEHLLEFSEAVLFEFLDAHRTIAEMTNALAQIFILLLSKGFGSTEDQTEKTAQGTEDSCGTGMGEGQGLNDVSDQIEDEAQLTGPAEKDVPDDSDIPSDKNKGIEMDEDFAADAFSVSEGSEDGDDGEDVDIESKMGETGDRNQIVDEKLWDKEKDAKPENSLEKYESGPSVEDMDSSGRELRAKEDDAPTAEESDQFHENEPDGQTEEQNDASDDENNDDDRMLDKDTAFEDPTGIETTEQEKYQEDDGMDEAQCSDTVEEGDSIPAESEKEMGDDDLSNPTDYVSDENSALTEEKHDSSDNLDNNDNKNVEQEPTKDVTESDKSESVEYSQDKVDISKQSQTPFSVDSSLEPRMCWSDSTNMNNGVAPSSVSKDEDLKMQFSMPNSSDDAKSVPNQPQPHISQGDTQPRHLKETNPYRSIGKAIEMWKEKVSVLDDADEEQPTNPDYMEEDESAVEYRYVSEGEKNTSQALGPATADQIKTNVDGSEGHNIEDGERRKEREDGMKQVQEHPEPKSLQSMNASSSRHMPVEETLETATGSDPEFEALPQNYTDDFLGNVVSFRRLDINNKTAALDFGVIDMDLSTSTDNEIISGNMNQKAIEDWKRYELATTRLSHELAEQLRLIMEPTLASRLQGDYKTGKRINMKKVIPYIASQFRRDKIWLRRTKPNKRDYQVVIAIDDSRSMSESNCGNLAIEALVTVCRAMSHVEVGQFAVSSFGGKGNIKLLHDFDQSFSGEAGVKIISSLSFKQDNTIVDEPVADLLKHLKGMLDSAMGNARTASGKNPMHQLTLIISDGRLNEKENLRRCVRNLLNTKRMVAFILLDSHEESIMDQMEAFVDGRTTTFKKYIDGFPFPYYIVLKNVEALPRTLADLLRQWFELMQRTGE